MVVDTSKGWMGVANKWVDSKRDPEESLPNPAVKILKDPKTGRFLPGNRPPGRKPGSVNSSTKARELLAAHTEELLTLALEQVRTGKSASLLSDLLRFAMPQARSQLAAVAIPAAEDALAQGDFDGALAEVTRSVLSGEVSPDSAKVVTDQIRGAEEAKRYRALREEVEDLSRKIIEGQARRVG